MRAFATIEENAIVRARFRILVAECGKEGGQSHRVAGALRDFGFEVIYMGDTFDADALCSAAIQEDVDVMVLSGVSEKHAEMFSALSALQGRKNIQDIPVVGVGLIAGTGAPPGLKAVFPPERTSSALVEWIRKEAKSER